MSIIIIAALIYMFFRFVKNARPERMFMQETVVAFDLETTGLRPSRAEIIEIGAVKYTVSDRSRQTFQILVKPSKKIPASATAINGITQEMVDKDGLELVDALQQFIAFIGDHQLIAYNLEFDMLFLKEALNKHKLKIKNKKVCALKKARRAFKDLDNYKLATVANYCGCKTEGTHRALKDSDLALSVYLEAMWEIESQKK